MDGPGLNHRHDGRTQFNPQFFLDVANDPWFVPGFTFLIILYLIGFFAIRKMVDLKV